MTDAIRHSSLATELPYWDFRDGTVILVDGTMARGMRLTGKSIDAWDDHAVNRLALDLRAFLNGLPDECEIVFGIEVNDGLRSLLASHVDISRNGAATCGDLLTSRVRSITERIRRRELRSRDLYLFAMRRPKRSTEDAASFAQRFFRTPREFLQRHRGSFEAATTELQSLCAALDQSLGNLGISTKPLTEAETFQAAHRFLNPRRASWLGSRPLETSFRNPEFTSSELKLEPDLATPSVREQLACSDLLLGLEGFVIDGLHHRVITLRSLPEATYAGMMTKLQDLPFEYVLQVHVRVPRQSEELSRLHARRRMAHSMSMSHGGRASDLESEAKLGATEEMIREVIGSGQKLFFMQLAVVVSGDDAEVVSGRAKQVLARFRDLGGADGLLETVAGFQIWKSMLPLACRNVTRARRIKTDNLADFLPIFQPYEGSASTDPVCLFENTNGGLVRFDPFGPTLSNYNTLVTGSSGSGKSFLNNLLLLQYMAQDPAVFVIDIGGSYRKLCVYFGGQYLELGPPEAGVDPRSINPFALPDGESKPSSRKLKFLVSLCELMLAEEDPGVLNRLDRSRLEEEIVALYGGTSAPTLGALADRFVKSKEADFQKYGKMLFPWTGDRPYGQLLDGKGSLALDRDLVVFDLKGLSSYPDLQAVMLLIITDFILCKVEGKAEAAKGRKKLILMDEAWELLKSRPAASFMEYCVRTLRKMGAGITFITQGLEEIVASPIGGAILSNTATKFVLRQRGDLEPVRQILKLNERELSLIGSLKQSKGSYSEAFMLYGDDRALIRLRPSPLEYWVATSDMDENRLIAERRATEADGSLHRVLLDLAREKPLGAKGRA